jgi:hypothetical protein
MKEQVSVDKDKFCDDFWSEFSKIVPEHLRPKLSIHHIRFMIQAFLVVLNEQPEYRRLKRLDENIKKNIAEYKEDLKIIGKNDCLISRKRLIELLESLYE